MAAGNTVEWSGTATGSVHLAGALAKVGGTTERNLAAAGSVVVFSVNAKSGRESLAVGNTVDFDGTAGRAARLGGNVVTFNGKTDGDLVVAANRAVVGGQAVVGGALTSYGDVAPVVDPGAKIAGGVKLIQPKQGQARPRPPRGGRLRGFLIRFFGMTVLGLLALLVAPRATTETADRIGRRPGFSLGIGVAVLVVAPVALLILLVTILGIPAMLVLAALYFVVLIMSGPMSSLFLGRRLLRAERSAFLALLLGVFIVALLGVIPILGPIVSLVAIIFGVGAEMAWLGAACGRQRPAAATPPSPPPLVQTPPTPAQ